MRLKLRQKRHEKNLTQKDMARLMHKEISAYQRWETGHSQGTAEDLILAAQIFECPIEDLFEQQNIVQNMGDVHHSVLGHVTTQNNYSNKDISELFQQLLSIIQENHQTQMEYLMRKWKQV